MWIGHDICIIDHGQGVLNIMIYLSRIDVAKGDFFKPGQVIDGVGATGRQLTRTCTGDFT
ncbi:MAG: M23 family metallopeptidase [Cyanobacteria bacterium P01_B01_bin.77]